jgi:hypothetical protein
MPKVVYSFTADTSGLGVQLKNVQVNLDKVDKNADKTKKSVKDLGKEAGSAKETFSQLAEGLGRVSPELGGVARAASSALGIIKGFSGIGGAAVGGLAAGISLVAAGYFKIREGVDQALQAQLDASNKAIKAEIDKKSAIDYVGQAILANERLSALEKKKIWAESFRSYVQFAEDASNAVLDIDKNVATKLANITGLDWFQKYADAIDTIRIDNEQYFDSFDLGAIDDQEKGLKALIDQNVALAQSYQNIKEHGKDMLATQRAIIDAQHELNRPDNDPFSDVQLKQLQYATSVTEALAQADGKVTKAEQEQIQTLKDLTKARGEVVQSMRDYKDQGPELEEVNKQILADQRASTEAALAWGNAYSSIASGVADTANNVAQFGEMSKGAQIALALVARAAALAQIAASTGSAIMQATLAATIAAAQVAAASGPAAIVTAPATFASLSAGMQASIIASAVASTAAVLSQPIPTHHAGGVSGAGEFLSLQQTGEATLNRNAAGRMGRETINALNRGAGLSGSSQVVSNVVGHRTMDTYLLKSLGRVQSPFRNAVQRLPIGVRPGRKA